jgi:hypothetical protein
MNLIPELDKRRKEFDELWDLYCSSHANFAVLESAARSFQKDFPGEIIGYQATMMLIGHAPLDKAQALAQEMTAAVSAPTEVRSWSKGFLYRVGLMGKPVDICFTALDGRGVNVAQMKGTVVLVEFWGPGCRGCVAAMPILKGLYMTLKPQGFEIIGIACATDREGLLKCIRENGIDWPQHFEGRRARTENTMTQRFGVNGIPHMFLLDKKGCLRRDNLRADNTMAKLVAQLLAE